MTSTLRRARRLLLAALAAPLLAVVAAAPAQAFTCLDNREFSLQSRHTGYFVRAETGYPTTQNAVLRAAGRAYGTQERFRIDCLGSGRFAIKSIANNRFVSAELNYQSSWYGALRARATTVGPWETFTFERTWDDPRFGAQGHLKSVGNGRYVSTEVNYTGAVAGMLRARATAKGPWEDYQLTWK